MMAAGEDVQEPTVNTSLHETWDSAQGKDIGMTFKDMAHVKVQKSLLETKYMGNLESLSYYNKIHCYNEIPKVALYNKMYLSHSFEGQISKTKKHYQLFLSWETLCLYYNMADKHEEIGFPKWSCFIKSHFQRNWSGTYCNYIDLFQAAYSITQLSCMGNSPPPKGFTLCLHCHIRVGW